MNGMQRWAAAGAAVLAMASAQGTPVWTGTPDLTIDGGSDGFGALEMVDSDARGRVFAVDRDRHHVRVFSPSGSPLATLGRQGGGGGELQAPCCIAFAPDGRLWVRDVGNQRYVPFSVADENPRPGTPLRMPHPARGAWARIVFDVQGRLLDVDHVLRPGEPVGTRVRYRLAPDGSVAGVDSIPDPPRDSLRVHMVALPRRIDGADMTVTMAGRQPFGPIVLRADAPGGGWASAVSSSYSVTMFAATGRRIRTISRAVEGPALTAEDRRRGDEELGSFVRQAGIERSAIPFGLPDRKPVLRGLMFDADGRLWVERSVPTGSAVREADLYDRAGMPVATLRWPAEVDIVDYGNARGMTALGVATDPVSGSQRVVRVRFAVGR